MPNASVSEPQVSDDLTEAIDGSVDIGSSQPSEAFLTLIPHAYARQHLIMSAGTNSDGVELLFTCERTSPAAVFNTGVRLGRPTLVTSSPADLLASAIDRGYAAHNARAARNTTSIPGSRDEHVPVTELAGSSNVESELSLLLRNADADLLNTQNKGPVVRLVDLLLFEAMQRSASDIHIQPLSDRVLVRYRLDGVLHTVRELPVGAAPGVISRVKVMARLDVAEQRAPQDGRATVTMGGSTANVAKRADLRISTLPTTYGERIVIRILDTSRSGSLLQFATLGMPEHVERPFLAQVLRSSGIVLSTGPTGSGKTTTLYTALAWITQTKAAAARGCELNIMTIEDPVEYDLSTTGLTISQTQLNSKKGVTFAAGLRHILRQDPDVIMVGEVRDEETARIAVQASLTGHLVLSTLHTNDAASAIARLLDLGVEPFLVSSSLAAVLAQRLVRRVHAHCRGKGCPGCMTTGYRGRTGVFELLVLDDALRAQIAKRDSANNIKATAVSKGMVSLMDAGRLLVRDGITTDEELARVIEGLE